MPFKNESRFIGVRYPDAGDLDSESLPLFFPSGGKTGAERETGQGHALGACSSERKLRPLTRLPRSVNSLRKKRGT